MTSFFTTLISILIFSLATTAQASSMGDFNVPANKGLFGPTAGGNATATYRSLVAADIPVLPYASSTLATGSFYIGVANVATAQTATQATAALNLFTAGLQGLAPASGGGAVNFLRADGTWATPAGSGTVTSTSVVTANGFSGTVATATTTPAITIIASGCNGVCKSNATTLSTATSGTDYSAGTSGNATGIVKSTTGTGALTTAVAGDFPTLNQNTTGTATNVTGTVAIGNGGTGQTTQTAAFNALSPSTTKGDVIVHNGTNNIRVGVGSDGQVLTADSAQASGVKWAASSGGGTSMQYVVFSGGGTGTACTGSPCTLNQNSSGISSVTRSAQATYVINFSPACASVPSCIGNTTGDATNDKWIFQNFATSSTTTANITVIDASGSAVDAAVVAHCTCP